MKLQQFALDIKLTRHDLAQLVTRVLSFYGIRILITAATQVWPTYLFNTAYCYLPCMSRDPICSGLR